MHIPALIKVLLLFIASKSYAIAWTAPNSTAPKPRTKTELRRSIFETKVKYFAKTAILIFLTNIGIDVVVTILLSGVLGAQLATDAAGVISAHACPSSTAPPGEVLTEPSAPLVFWTFVLAVAAAGRIWCYRTLGTHFRFEVAIQEKHRLITTGPYAIVRHPSYFVTYGIYFGACGIFAANGTWARECVLQAPTSVFVDVMKGQCGFEMLLTYPVVEYVVLIIMGLWLVVIVWTERSVASRLVWEDALLEREFGKEWHEYARRAPWRIVPFVY